MENLALKYRPKTFDDIVGQENVVAIVKELVKQPELPNRNLLLIGPRGTGKANTLDTEIATPSGFKRMGDIELGDEVFTHTGALGKVSGIFPQGLKDVYRIKTSDNLYIDVTYEHINFVSIFNISRAAYYEVFIETRYLIQLFHAQEELGIRLYLPTAPKVITYMLSNHYITKTQASEAMHSGRIESIEKVDTQLCQCIMIDHPDHTYVCNRSLIPTHNTTTGRIIANELNQGIGSPIEFDAASHSGVDSMRELVSQAKQYPIGSKYKVFIIDECHALSSSAWSSLLRTLESQPAKSVFIFLTTNPEKIPQTIISRVQVFQLSTLSLDQLVSRLKYVIEKENSEGRGITYEDDAILYIAKLAKGGMRDALTLLDKALVNTSNITSLSLKSSLNLPEYDDYFLLLNAYASKDVKSIMEIVSRVYNSGVNFIKWFEGFQSFVLNLAKYIFTKDISCTMIPSYYESKIVSYNVNHARICLSLSQMLIDLISSISKTEYMEEVAISYLCK